MNYFLVKYGYIQPQYTLVGIRFEMVGISASGKIIYSINTGSIATRQKISTANISLWASYRIAKAKSFLRCVVLAMEEHFDMVVLKGKLPPVLGRLSEKFKNHAFFSPDGTHH